MINLVNDLHKTNSELDEIKGYSEIKVIEGMQYLRRGSIKINKNNALFELPSQDMIEVEIWEERLVGMNLPYVLAQVRAKDEDNQYVRGYMLFLMVEHLDFRFPKADERGVAFEDPDSTLEGIIRVKNEKRLAEAKADPFMKPWLDDIERETA